MCYSATLDANIREIVKDYVTKPVRIEIGQTSKPSDRVELRVYTVMQDQKLGLLDQMLREEEGTFLVFSRTKHGADRISKKLEKLGHDADVIHGDRSQSQRTAALKGFANGRHRVLVATDVAARGIDVNDIAHVINYDLPNASDDFVHRIGRTGRAGKKGVATTFVMPQEKSDARKLERELKIKFEWREADKNLQKEERNKPVDMTAPATGDVMQMETRSWRGNDPVEPMTPNPYSTRNQAPQGTATPVPADAASPEPRTAAPAPAAPPEHLAPATAAPPAASIAEPADASLSPAPTTTVWIALNAIQTVFLLRRLWPKVSPGMRIKSLRLSVTERIDTAMQSPRSRHLTNRSNPRCRLLQLAAGSRNRSRGRIALEDREELCNRLLLVRPSARIKLRDIDCRSSQDVARTNQFTEQRPPIDSRSTGLKMSSSRRVNPLVP